MGIGSSTPCLNWCKGATIDLSASEVQSARSMKLCSLCQTKLRYKMKQDKRTAILAKETMAKIRVLEEEDKYREKHWKRCSEQYDKDYKNKKEMADKLEEWRETEHKRQEEMKKSEHDRRMAEQKAQREDKIKEKQLENDSRIARMEKQEKLDLVALEIKKIEERIKKMETEKEMKKMDTEKEMKKMETEKEMKKLEVEALRLQLKLANSEKQKENNFEDSSIPHPRQSVRRAYRVH